MTEKPSVETFTFGPLTFRVDPTLPDDVVMEIRGTRNAVRMMADGSHREITYPIAVAAAMKDSERAWAEYRKPIPQQEPPPEEPDGGDYTCPKCGSGAAMALCKCQPHEITAAANARIRALEEKVEPGEDEPSDAEVAVSYLAGLARRSGNGTHIDDALATVRAALRAAAGPDASDARRVAFEEYLRGERSATSFCAAMKIADVLAMEAADERPLPAAGPDAETHPLSGAYGLPSAPTWRPPSTRSARGGQAVSIDEPTYGVLDAIRTAQAERRPVYVIVGCDDGGIDTSSLVPNRGVALLMLSRAIAEETRKLYEEDKP